MSEEKLNRRDFIKSASVGVGILATSTSPVSIMASDLKKKSGKKTHFLALMF